VHQDPTLSSISSSEETYESDESDDETGTLDIVLFGAIRANIQVIVEQQQESR
jgi:hypothetical protein